MNYFFRSKLPPDPQLVALVDRTMQPANLTKFAEMVLTWLLLLFAVMVVVALGQDTHPLDLLGRTWGWSQWAGLLVMPALWLALGWMPEQFRYRSIAIGSVVLVSGFLGYQLMFPRGLRVQGTPSQRWLSPTVWYVLETIVGLGVLVSLATVGVTVLQYQPTNNWYGRLLVMPCWFRDSLILVLNDLAMTPYRATAVLIGLSAALIAGMTWMRSQHAQSWLAVAKGSGQRALEDSAVVGKAVVIDGPERSLSRNHQTALSSRADPFGAWTWEATWYILSRNSVQSSKPVLVAQLASPRTALVRVWWMPASRRWALWTYADREYTLLDWPMQRWTRTTVQFRSTRVELWLDEQLSWSHPVKVSTPGSRDGPEDWTWELKAPTGVFGYVRSVQMYPHANVVFANATARE